MAKKKRDIVSNKRVSRKDNLSIKAVQSAEKVGGATELLIGSSAISIPGIRGFLKGGPNMAVLELADVVAITIWLHLKGIFRKALSGTL